MIVPATKTLWLLWESTKPDPCVFHDWLLTPVGNRDGLANYVGLPGLNCEGLCDDR